MSAVASPSERPVARVKTRSESRRPESRSAWSAWRWAIIVSPVVAGVLATVGAIADPAPGKDGRELVEAYAANAGAVQIKSLAYHFSYAMWIPMVFGLVALARRGGAGWLANIAAVFGVLGVTTMPGFVVVDFLDVAAGQQIGAEAAVRMGETVESMWALPLMAGTGAFGFIFSLPLAAAAAWRAGVLPVWGLAGVVVGLLAFMLSGPSWPGTVVMTLGFAALAVALARMDRRVWQPRTAAAAEAA